MNEVVENEVEESMPLIDRWNRWLLGLLAVEVGILTLGFFTLVGGRRVYIWEFQDKVLETLLFGLTIGYLGNLIGAIGTLVLALSDPERGKGILGFGHLVNIIYVASVGWLFMLVVMLWSPGGI